MHIKSSFLGYKNCICLTDASPNILYPIIFLSQGWKKNVARSGFGSRVSRLPCELSLRYRPVAYADSTTNLLGTMPEPTKQYCSFAARNLSMDPHQTTKCHRGRRMTWPDRDSNPGPLAYRANTLSLSIDRLHFL